MSSLKLVDGVYITVKKSGHLFDSLYSKTENSNNDLKNKKMQCIEFYLGPNEFKYDGSIYDKFKL
ncbi:hypothetical protein A3Q56_03790 [Intoshia linei]|uniref:Uncharacterized protein n=1 Tax=Intoshia linei TaxID=1819745 RepID=A0A177B4Y2_9BILA|nr:hypothetical protein A3Q56_03790 [Intoshia linei]